MYCGLWSPATYKTIIEEAVQQVNHEKSNRGSEKGDKEQSDPEQKTPVPGRIQSAASTTSENDKYKQNTVSDSV